MMGEKTDQPAGKASQPAVNKVERSQDDIASTSSSGESMTAPTESKAKPIENIRIAVILLGMGLAIFLGALVRPARKDLRNRSSFHRQDMNIVATAIPAITNEFNSADDVGWYGSA